MHVLNDVRLKPIVKLLPNHFKVDFVKIIMLVFGFTLKLSDNIKIRNVLIFD